MDVVEDMNLITQTSEDVMLHLKCLCQFFKKIVFSLNFTITKKTTNENFSYKFTNK